MQDPRSERFIRSRMKTRHLVLLDELGEHRSILHAAIAANMTQPAASKMLSELEQLLGTPLFERLPRGVTPTPFGEIMIRRARAALAEMNLAHQEVMNLMSGLNGRVAVGTVLTPATDLLPAAVLHLKSRYPKLHVAIEVDTSKSLLARLRSGQLEMMVGRILEPEAAGELDFEPLSDEPHCIFARAGHPLQARDDLRLDDLACAGRIQPAQGSILRDRLTALFLSAGLDLPEQTIETTSLPMITQLLAQSDMLVALPRAVVRTYLENRLLAALPIELELRLDPYGIVTRRNHPLSPGGQAMLQALRITASAASLAACPRRGQFADPPEVEAFDTGL
jgi:DNA-binding transcriptional LysR family regulator